MTTTRDPHLPPPPPFATPLALEADELEVDLGDEQLDLPTAREDDQDTALERVEFVGEYPSVEAYFKAQLEPEVSVACLWLLDCLDMTAVLERFSDGGRFRYVIEGGEVYRVGLDSRDPPDPAGPWMPTRGA
jgi:hypothetical protein